MEPRMDFKSLDKSVRKQKIIDTAVNVFHQKGYRSATLDDVATALGLTKAALYHYVSSKEELLSIIYIQALEQFFAKAYEIGETDLPPTEKLRALIRHHIKHIIIDNLAMFAVFFSEENQLPEKDFQTIRREKQKYTQVVQSILEEGMAQGYFRRSDPWVRACAIIGMCNWLYKWYRPEGGRQTPDEIADHFISLLEDGYLASSAETERAPESRKSPKGRSRTARVASALRKQARVLARLADEIEGGS